MMQYIIMAAQLIVGLSLLVFVHELGHFLAAKMFGIRVTKFYIFFDAWGKKLFSKQIGETEYGFGWLPLGGYVQIAGMVDETQDSSKLSATPEPWEFRSKPAWQRLIVMLGGIVMNIITGFIIFFFYLHHFEKSYTPVAEINKDGIFAHKLAQKIGFETGDKIMSVNGETPVRFEDVLSTKTILGGTITVERQGQMKTVQIPDDFYKELVTGQKFIEPMHQEIFVEAVAKGAGAEKAGMQIGDKIVAIDSVKVERFSGLQELLCLKSNQKSIVSVERNQQITNLEAQIDSAGKLGFVPKFKLPYKEENYTWANALQYSWVEGREAIMTQVVGLRKMFSGKIKATESISSPIGIAKVYGGTWDWGRFWRLTATISFVLAFMNLLPIPALDGGHILFLLPELLFRRKLSEAFLEKAQMAGMILLLGLMVFAFGNDIYKGVTGKNNITQVKPC